MAKSRIKTEFKVNQQIVYPSQGVGKITEIFEKEFNGETVAYYKIYLEVSDMIVMVPVNNAKDLGIRAIVEASEAKKALNMLSEDFEPITSDWKLRYQMNLELLKKGSIADIAQIVRCLYNRSKVKELPIMERKLYESAKKLLEDEISFALGKTAKEIEAEMLHVQYQQLKTQVNPHFLFNSLNNLVSLINIDQEKAIQFKAIQLQSKEEAQNAPTPVTTYAFFCDGEYVTNEQMNDKRFLKRLGL